MLIPHSDYKPYIKQYVKTHWLLEWDLSNENKLYKINSLVEKQQPKLSSIRHEMVIRRARIGHTYITHKYLMTQEDQPMCDTCDVPLTVNHILIDCSVYQNIRLQHFSETSLKELFKNQKFSEIINFLKDIEMYYKF